MKKALRLSTPPIPARALINKALLAFWNKHHAGRSVSRIIRELEHAKA